MRVSTICNVVWLLLAVNLSLNKARLIKICKSFGSSHYRRILNTTGVAPKVRPKNLTDYVFHIGVKLLSLVRYFIFCVKYDFLDSINQVKRLSEFVYFDLGFGHHVQFIMV